VKVTVFVSPKKTVLDPQGAAVEHAIHSLGLVGASQVRVGKTITFQLEGTDTPEVRQKIEQIARDLLANPVIEDFTYTID
jgi:phosphoribosylformylglycinamidine synthase PurS subunit